METFKEGSLVFENFRGLEENWKVTSLKRNIVVKGTSIGTALGVISELSLELLEILLNLFAINFYHLISSITCL